MLRDSRAFSGFSVDDIRAAKAFYADVLGLDVTEEHCMLTLHLNGERPTFVYPKDGHVPATYTILNFPVENIDTAVDELTARGVEFVRYPDLPQDEKGVARGLAHNRGPDIAWFTDPAGNIFSVLQEA
ncbi:predicted enzyme related to lactoylglutathione lyase [Jatrophihabitans sp. GAS493]|uniref:VOC family protein n=1 Tax=Jatrophihabitans sp. GAS493 TaxID=1907575 RepID=UPI000BB8E7C1|nr:VOC family protein [Jatrophihabitans sp. GAS493]SOD74938.1 predicted enzyme related to lactoylglutathione lyase [Jatrophihabitans sp. GAS493]